MFFGLFIVIVSLIIPVTLAQIQISPLGQASFVGNDVDSKGVLWAGDKGFNLYKSTDNGVSFSKIFTLSGVYDSSNPYSGHVWNVYVDSRNYIFASAGGTGALFRSTNGGASFSQVLKTNGSSLESFYISMTEDNTGNLYTVTYTSGGAVPHILKSVDGGSNWFKVGSFSVLHYHNIKYNTETGYLYVVTGEGTYTDSAKILRSTDGGATWTTVVQRNDNLGTVYLGMAFSGRYVYVGQDYPNRVCQIHRFYDDGSNNIAVPQIVYTPPADGQMPFISGSNLANSLVFANTAENVNGVARIVASVDGVNWNVIKSQSVSYISDNRWNIFTAHSRSGIIFGTIRPGENYKIIDGPAPSPTNTPSPTPTATPSPTPSPTLKPTITPTPTPSPTATPIPTPTATPTPSPTATQTPEPTPTETPIPTPTIEPPPTQQPITSSSTALTVTNTKPTPTPKPQQTNSPKPTPSTTISPSPTTTPTVIPTPNRSSQNSQSNTSLNLYINGIIIALIVLGSFVSVAITKKVHFNKKVT